MSRMLRLRFTTWPGVGLTQHRRRDDDAYTEDDRAGDNRRGHIAVLNDFSCQMSGRALVKNLVAQNRRNNSNGREQQHIADRLQQRLRVPGG